MRALLLFAVLASCWRGPAETTHEPIPRAPRLDGEPDPPRQQTRPPSPRGPSLASNSPGPLAIVHQAWDDPSGCLQCHVTVGATAPTSNDRCLGCHDHEKIAVRIAAGTGLHATPPFRSKPCVSCHQEHRGPRFDLMGWTSMKGGAAAFDHALVGWQMPVAYRSLRCTQCHTTIDSQGLQLYLGADRAQYP